MEYLGFSGIVVIAVFVVFILTKKTKETTDYLLILFNILLALFVGLNSIDPIRLTSVTLIAQNALPFFFFPVFVFLILNTIYAKEYSKAWSLLFLPGVIFLVLTSVRHLSIDFTPQMVLEEYNTPPLYYHFFFKGFQLLILVVLAYLMKELKTYQKQIENRFSNLEYIEVSWLFNFSVVYLVNTLLTMILFLSSNFQLFPINIQLAFTIINSILVFSLYYMNYKGIRHYSIAHYQSQLQQPSFPAVAHESDTKQEFVNDKAISEKNSRIFQRAKETMEAQKLFLEPNLRIKDLAITMDENAHNLSESINSVGNKSFYDFVNSYRVEHLKMMLTDESKQGFTILALGLESGFNSKASLNRIFKQTTGLTPLQYQKASLHSV